MLNLEQERIMKEIIDEKKKNPNDPLYALVIGGVGVGKMFIYSNIPISNFIIQ